MKPPPKPSAPGQRSFDFSPGSDPGPRRLRDLETHLRELVGENLDGVVLTDNRRRILSAGTNPQRPGRLRVRLHRSFLLAEDELLALVADFVTGRLQGARRRQAVTAFREHFERHAWPEDSPPAPRRVRLRPSGSHFDLEEMRDRLIAHYFRDETFLPAGRPPAITWGRWPSTTRRRPRRRTLRLGSYDARRHLIRIHPVLDRRDVPLHVVESIVHHEILHAVIPTTAPCSTAGAPSPKSPRRRIHPPEFRRRERLFAHYDDAEAWLVKHFDRLVKARRGGG
jgi:hypothetical protein